MNRADRRKSGIAEKPKTYESEKLANAKFEKKRGK